MPGAQDVVAQLNETLNAHDVAAGRALYDEKPRLVMASGHELDLDGLDRMMEMTLKAFPDMRMDVDDLIAAYDAALVNRMMTVKLAAVDSDGISTLRQVTQEESLITIN